jgi:hypothetical protein
LAAARLKNQVAAAIKLQAAMMNKMPFSETRTGAAIIGALIKRKIPAQKQVMAMANLLSDILIGILKNL